MNATFIFGTQSEQRAVETLPSIGATVAGPDNSPWTITGIVTTPTGATLTCQPADAPSMIFGDGSFPITS